MFAVSVCLVYMYMLELPGAFLKTTYSECTHDDIPNFEEPHLQRVK